MLGLRSILIAATLFTFSYAQSSSSLSSNSNSSATPTPSASSNSTSNSTNVITTTITSLVPGPSGSSSASSTSLLTLTLTLTSSADNRNATVVNGTTTDNSTATNTTEPWQEGDGWLPFRISIDPAYGVLGAVLIISGIPVAVLGGKNRWSSLAIVSGYSLMLFTLIMILRFGVEPNLQPPSPNPPSTTLRGLYLLACLIASFIGAGLGIFLFNFARYFVAAAGGFTFGWFLLETKSGGLLPSVLGRWALLGCLTVGGLLMSLVPKCNEPMMLISTAWIGATAFVLGVDCYTRAGLKEFYIYNLGFHDLFPKLEGAKYPLTQTMMIELGILAAVVIIGSAIQARVLNRLQKKLRTAREEEEMRMEAEEVAKAAERFKNVGSELSEWEEKHGKGASGDRSKSPTSGRASTSQLPILGHDDREDDRSRQGKRSSAFSLPQIEPEGRVLYEGLPLSSPPPTRSEMGTPTTDWFSTETLKDDEAPRNPVAATTPVLSDPELEDKLKLLEQVKKARESIRGSIDGLRKTSATPTPGRLETISRSITPTLSLRSDGHTSSEPMTRYSTGSKLSLDPDSVMARRTSFASGRMLDPQDSDKTRRQSSSSSRILDLTQGKSVPGTPISPTASEWDKYVAGRQILAPPAAVSPTFNPSRISQYSMGRDHTADIGRRERTTSMIDLPALTTDSPPRIDYFSDQRHSRTSSMLEPRAPAATAGQFDSLPSPVARVNQAPTMYDPPADSLGPGRVTGSASHNRSSQLLDTGSSRPQMQRTMTYEELAERHRKRLSALQDPITSKMKEEQEVRLAKEKWERQKQAERAELAHRQKNSQADVEKARVKQEEKVEVLKTTDEWRRSVHGGLDGSGRGASPGASGTGNSRGARRTSGLSYAN